MGVSDRWGDLPLIADTSAWTNLPRTPPDVQQDFRAGLYSNQIVTSPVVKLELLHHARNAAEFELRDRTLAALRELPLSKGVGDAAIGALRDLKDAGSPGYHRVAVPDALVAATASLLGYAVLFYDRHFVKLASVLSFTPVWIVPHGSIT